MGLHEAMLWESHVDNKVTCKLCAHRCAIAPGKLGYCSVRENREGILYTHTFGRLIAENVDPIEKKPLYHVLPGTLSYSVATIGCNFRCDFCQNWQISQTGKDGPPPSWGRAASPESIVDAAVESGCRSIAFTYTEPTIYFEYAYDTAKIAREKGLTTLFVTNGYMTPEAVETIAPFLDAANVDLKAFRDSFYRKRCGARLEPVKETIRTMRSLGIWVEVTTLVIPGQNDSEEELDELAAFVASVDPVIPWHISRFFPQYKLSEPAPTPLGTLHMAADLGTKHGLPFVYIGNTGEDSSTRCSSCGRVLIVRSGYSTTAEGLREGTCAACGTRLPGVF